MPTFQFQKLVRDNIATWHREAGHIPKERILDGEELTTALCKKLHEEADEVHAADTREKLIEEIADVQQIIDDLLIHNGITLEDLKKVQDMKRDKKGGFSKGIYIESVIIPDENDEWAQYCRKDPVKYPES